MKVEWSAGRCILCLEPFAEEGRRRRSWAHFPPESIGGQLAMDCVCEGCNNHVGTTFEKYLPLDPGIRHAIEILAPRVPLLAESRSRPGRRFIGKTDGGIVRLSALREGGYRLHPTSQPDGRIQDTTDTEREIGARLTKAGAGPAVIEEAIRRLHDGERVNLEDLERNERYTYIPRESQVEPGLPYDEPLAPPEAFLSIAFLYLACCLGPDWIYDERFEEVRQTLQRAELGTTGETWDVASGLARVPYEPAHIMAVTATDPPTVRVQLFRDFIYDVRLPSIDVTLSRILYSVDLESEDEAIANLDDSS